MALITRSQVVKAPIDTVFATIVDGGDFAAWNPTIRGSRRLDELPPGNGVRFEWDLRGFGKVVQELQEFERPRRVRIVPHIKRLEGGHRSGFRQKRTGRGSSTSSRCDRRARSCCSHR